MVKLSLVRLQKSGTLVNTYIQTLKSYIYQKKTEIYIIDNILYFLFSIHKFISCISSFLLFSLFHASLWARCSRLPTRSQKPVNHVATTFSTSFLVIFDVSGLYLTAPVTMYRDIYLLTNTHMPLLNQR